MGGECCATASIQKTQSICLPEVVQERYEQAVTDDSLQRRIDEIALNNDPVEALLQILSAFLPTHCICSHYSGFAVHCNSCDLSLCTECFLRSDHMHHDYSLLQDFACVFCGLYDCSVDEVLENINYTVFSACFEICRGMALSETLRGNAVALRIYTISMACTDVKRAWTYRDEFEQLCADCGPAEDWLLNDEFYEYCAIENGGFLYCRYEVFLRSRELQKELAFALGYIFQKAQECGIGIFSAELVDFEHVKTETVEELGILVAMVEYVNAQVDYRAVTDLDSYCNFLVNIVLPLVNNFTCSGIQYLMGQIQGQSLFWGDDMGIVPVPVLTLFLLAGLDNSNADGAECAFCDELIPLAIRWLKSIEFACYDEDLYNIKQFYFEMTQNKHFVRVFFVVVNECERYLRRNPQRFVEICFEAEEDSQSHMDILLSCMVIAEIQSFNSALLSEIDEILLVNQYFLHKDIMYGGIAYSPLLAGVFSFRERSNILKSRIFLIEKLALFHPEFFPALPNYYYTNMSISKQSRYFEDQLMDVEAEQLNIQEYVQKLELLYINSNLTIHEKICVLKLFKSECHTSKLQIRYPDARLLIEKNFFRISHTTDYSKSMSQLLASKVNSDKHFVEDEPWITQRHADESVESVSCEICHEDVLNPVYFAQIMTTFNGKEFIKICSHYCHLQCYTASCPVDCPVCGMNVNYLVSSREQMKQINALFGVEESQLLSLMIDTIDYCSYVAKLAQMAEPQKRSIILPSRKTLSYLQGMLYISDAYDRKIKSMMQLESKVNVITEDVFPKNISMHMIENHRLLACSECGASGSPALCLNCKTCLCEKCPCACKGFLKWNINLNQIVSGNGAINLPAPYENSAGEIPGGIFECGELIFSQRLLDEITIRILE